MTPSILVLLTGSAPAERAPHYAALLGAPIQARVVSLNLTAVQQPLAARQLAPVAAGVATGPDGHPEPLLPRPLPATLPEEHLAALTARVAAAVRQHQPQLLVMELGFDTDGPDSQAHQLVLCILRATQLPLLLLPAAAAGASLPHHVLLALDGDAFTPNAAARRLAGLLAAIPAAYVVAHVTEDGESPAVSGPLLRAEVRASMLLPKGIPLDFCLTSHEQPAAGLVHACHTLDADMLVLIARPRSFWGRRFQRSTTARVLSRSRQPVLLLPTEDTD